MTCRDVGADLCPLVTLSRCGMHLALGSL